MKKVFRKKPRRLVRMARKSSSRHTLGPALSPGVVRECREALHGPGEDYLNVEPTSDRLRHDGRRIWHHRKPEVADAAVVKAVATGGSRTAINDEY